MSIGNDSEIVVIGAGLAGIATAYYLCTEHKFTSVLLLDSDQPMSFTTAQSGDNYRNWWPHPTMVDFTNDSINLMETIARTNSNVLRMTRRGYVLATRNDDISALIAELYAGYQDPASIRVHGTTVSASYQPAVSTDWTNAPQGVDVLSNQKHIRQTFPSFDSSIANVIHIRRAGDFSGQQLGQYMLEKIKQAGATRLTAKVMAIAQHQGFVLEIDGANGPSRIHTDVVVNAAGPFAQHIAQMIGTELPINNIFHQKIAFEDSLGAVPRHCPFSIDLDEKALDWSEEEREWLRSEPDLAWLAENVMGGTHCRPEGGDHGNWVKLGWAYNQSASEPHRELLNEPRYNSHFPEIVMRAAAKLQPSLNVYVDEFPKRWTHYGGYYTMTRENWPLIGPLNQQGAFIVGALSGFGSMAACGAGSLVARHIAGKPLPAYAALLGLARFNNRQLMANISGSNTGIL